MNSFELNKIIGAVLGTLLFVMGVGFLAEAVYHPIEDRGPGYPLPEPETTEVADAGAAGEQATPLPVLLASASADAGASAVRKCQSCHTFEEGGANKTGPALYGVVGRPIAGHEGYSYSDALLQHSSETWTYEHLDAFLTNPQAFASGSKMPLSVGDPEERADILAYLQTLSAEPVPFPEAEAAPAEGEAAGAEEAPAGAATDEPVEAEATDTPTVTQDESPVEGTPVGGGTPAATDEPVEGAEEAPAEGAASTDGGMVPATEAPAAQAPAEEAPAQ